MEVTQATLSRTCQLVESCQAGLPATGETERYKTQIQSVAGLFISIVSSLILALLTGSMADAAEPIGYRHVNMLPYPNPRCFLN